MFSSQIDSQDEQTYLLIRLPKETVERAKASGSTSSKAGSIYVYPDGRAEFQDENSLKVYALLRNEPIKEEKGPSRTSHCGKDEIIANEESDLIKISLQKNDAIHLGKVKLSTLFAVPKVDERDASAVS